MVRFVKAILLSARPRFTNKGCIDVTIRVGPDTDAANDERARIFYQNMITVSATIPLLESFEVLADGTAVIGAEETDAVDGGAMGERYDEGDVDLTISPD